MFGKKKTKPDGETIMYEIRKPMYVTTNTSSWISFRRWLSTDGIGIMVQYHVGCVEHDKQALYCLMKENTHEARKNCLKSVTGENKRERPKTYCGLLMNNLPNK